MYKHLIILLLNNIFNTSSTPIQVYSKKQCDV